MLSAKPLLLTTDIDIFASFKAQCVSAQFVNLLKKQAAIVSHHIFMLNVINGMSYFRHGILENELKASPGGPRDLDFRRSAKQFVSSLSYISLVRIMYTWV